MEKEITANSERILKHLFHISEPFLFSWFNDKALEPSLLEEIKNINELFPFIPLMFVMNKQVSAIAIQKVSELLAHIPASCLAGFDESLRKLSYPNLYEALCKYWYHLEPSLLEKIDCNTLTPIKILCCHPSGYVRFNAIRILVEINIKEAIPFLILRANDWVNEIRAFCLGILLEVIDDKNVCPLILEYLPLVKQLTGKGRYDQIELTKKIELNLLTSFSEVLFNKLQSQDLITSRYAFSILSSSSQQMDRLLDATINHKDIIIKLNAFNLAKTYYESEQFLIYLSKLANSSFMIIRKKALYAIVESYPYQAKEYLEMALLDKSESIRNLGIYYLKQRGVQEFTHYYMHALNSLGAKPHLLLGLSAVGSKKDFGTISLLIDRYPGLQAALIVVAYKLRPDDWQNIIRDILRSPDASKLNAFANCLINTPESYSFSEMTDLIYGRENALRLRYFLKIINKVNYGRWRVLNFILDELIYYKDKECKLLIENYLLHWIFHNSPTKSFIRLSKDESLELNDKLNKVIALNPNCLIYERLKENIQCFSYT